MWVKRRNTRGEHMFSLVHPTTDIAKILRHVRLVPSYRRSSIRETVARRRHFAHDWLMIDTTTSTDLVTLSPFGREDFSRLISWLPTEADPIEWCAAFFQYPLTDAQLERYLEITKQPNVGSGSIATEMGCPR
jgi:hypothetical protein